MPTISNTVINLDSSAPTGYQRDVKITLVYDSETQALPVASTSPESSPIGTLRLRMDTQGAWSTDLIDNSIIEPAGSAYKVVEGSGTDSRTYFIEVADEDAEVKDILVAEPDFTP